MSMDIEIKWKHDGALVVSCGDAVREIPEGELVSQIKANQEGRARSSNWPSGVTPITVTSGVYALDNAFNASERYCGIAKTIDDMNAGITRAIKGERTIDELFFALDTDAELSAGDIKAAIAHQPTNLIVEFFPIVRLGWKP